MLSWPFPLSPFHAEIGGSYRYSHPILGIPGKAGCSSAGAGLTGVNYISLQKVQLTPVSATLKYGGTITSGSCGNAIARVNLTRIVRYDNILRIDNSQRRNVMRKTRPVSWIKAALKDFEAFPEGAKSVCLAALTIAAEGGKADIAKPMQGLGSGVFEIALPFRGNAYRVIYAVQMDDDIWVVHAFQKKSKRGTKTPKLEMDLIKARLRGLKEMLR